MSNQFILTDMAEGVLTVTLNRPDVLNSCHSAMASELQTAFASAAAEPAVRAVILTGAGRAFCAGQDLDEARSSDGEGLKDFAVHVRTVYNPLVRLIRALPKPVVAAVNGVAAGAGANLALSCDFVIASSQASFIQAFSKIGLVPDTGGTFFLPRLVGLARAAAMTMLAEKVTAEQALSYGMIYRVVEPSRLMEESSALARSLAGQATLGLALTKQLLNASLANNLDAQLELEAEKQGAAGRSEDYTEGVNAFLAKRAPTFRGK
jgi:2-(1,2-epoxy-1,2-dihydrophenyl)acetyl-CoA isomerase